MATLVSWPGGFAMKTALAAAAVLLCVSVAPSAELVTVMAPPRGEKANQIACEAFVNTWNRARTN